MAVSATTSSDSASALGALSSTAGTSADSEQRFLKLLVTQLNNQDPLNPLDNAELTSQLAQMSTVSGIEKLNTAFQSLLAQSGSSQVLQSASLIGRAVLVPGAELTLAQGVTVPFAVEVPQGADSAKVTVTDAAGNTVRSFDLGGLPPGVKTLSWDGRSDAGAPLADGAYRFNVTASTGDSRVTATALTYATVASVSQGGRGVALDLGSGGQAALSDVRLIL
ncbi:flagellar hook assembly protein FlgD [Rhodoferax sp.]|uniref:flagellar hook assembly protein FlgD n=1 Tax=Rhodoferax sp. TaxID=50421 RepID=UPI003BB6E55F